MPLLFPFLLLSLAPHAAAQRRVRLEGRQLYLDGEIFEVRGICYSPVPINESVYFAPYGDYFTADYSFIWRRDLPLIKEMGANVLRTYGWSTDNDHSDFLDAAAELGLKVMATFYMGDATETPVQTKKERTKVLDNFRKQVAQYATHSALLFWSFGNELNGVWNGFLQQLGNSEVDPCMWDERFDDLGGCWVHKGTAPTPDSQCYESSYCVYSRLFSFIEEAAVIAKEEADVLVISAFADVDALYDKIARAGDKNPSADAWTAQVYRGNSFGDFFEKMSAASAKPVLLTEYGVDAYHDACGTSSTTPCFNTLGDSSNSYEDQLSQMVYASNLSTEIIAHSSIKSECKVGQPNASSVQCSALGGFLMSWTDEYWKGAKAQAGCDPTYDDPAFSVKTCDEKAHVTCGDWNASQHDLCGYALDAAPDHYVNEEWFGVTSPTKCADSIDSLRVREIFWHMRELWLGKPKDESLFPSCEELVNQRCVALGDGGHEGTLETWMGEGSLFQRLFGSRHHTQAPATAQKPESEEAKGKATGSDLRNLPDLPVPASAPLPLPNASSGYGSLPCSGHGVCTTDWKQCGPGDANKTATPCCTCDVGFAGVGCDQLDARMYVVLGSCALFLFLVSLLAAAVAFRCLSGCTGRRVGTSPSQRQELEASLMRS